MACFTGHPHGCGESLFVRGYSPSRDGSSPRVWGKRGEAAQPAEAIRVIPTGVGKATAQ